MSAVSPLRDLMDAALEGVAADAASVQAFDEELDGLRLVDCRGFHQESARFWELVVPESASTCGMALATGKRIVVPDQEAEAALAGTEDLAEYRRSGLRAVQSTPLIAGDGRVVGMLSTHWRTEHDVSDAELHLIDALAARVAAVVAQEQSLAMPLNVFHDVNLNIRELAARFEAIGGKDFQQAYICECGCGEWVALTLMEFDGSVATQSPVVVPGHIVARAQAARRFSRLLRSDAAALRAQALQRRRKTGELRNEHQRPE